MTFISALQTVATVSMAQLKALPDTDYKKKDDFYSLVRFGTNVYAINNKHVVDNQANDAYTFKASKNGKWLVPSSQPFTLDLTM